MTVFEPHICLVNAGMTPSSLLRAGLSLKGVQRTVLSLVRGGLGNDGVRTAENKNVKINSSVNGQCGSIMFALNCFAM